jgi:hypothetical protein
MTITRLQFKGASSLITAQPSFNVQANLDSVPQAGNLLIAQVASTGHPDGVNTITQGNVNWTKVVKAQYYNVGLQNIEIWKGTYTQTPGTTVTVNVDSTYGVYGSAVVCVAEYSGLSGEVDRTYPYTPGSASTYLTTGTTEVTTQNNELWLGALNAEAVAISQSTLTYSNPLSSFSIVYNSYQLSSYWGWGASLAFLEKTVNSTNAASSGATLSQNGYWVGCIATFPAASTIIVPVNGLYSGTGSKQTTKSYNGANVIMQVSPNVPTGDFGESAVIENLVIDGSAIGQPGQIQPGTVGILLQNVYNCCIRNLTIQNCDVGIKVDVTNGNWSQANRFEHIRMINVNRGIVFTSSDGTGDDFGFTVIDDVGIQLSTNSGAVGIQLGTAGGPILKLYSSFIKANVWFMDNTYVNTTGMNLFGEIKYSLVNFEVEGGINSPYQFAINVFTNESNAVYYNQSFMLTYDSAHIGGVNIAQTDIVKQGSL